MKNNNLSLLFKQSIKNIFAFKIQFIVILILSFLSTSILSLSMTTNRRLEKQYENIVLSQKKFKKNFELKVGENSKNEQETDFVPILDFVGPDYSGLNYNYIKNNKKIANSITSDYNLMLSSKNEKEANFITKTFASGSFLEIFQEIYKDKSSMKKVKEFIDESKKTNNDNGEKNVIMKIADLLFQNYIKDITNKEEYLKNTIMGKKSIDYLNKSKVNWYEAFQEQGIKDINWSYIFNKKANLLNQETEATKLLNYTYYTFYNLGLHVFKTMFNFKIEKNNLIESNEELIKNKSEKIEELEKTDKLKEEIKELEKGIEEVKKDINLSNIYAFIFGKDIRKELEKNFIDTKNEEQKVNEEYLKTYIKKLGSNNQEDGEILLDNKTNINEVILNKGLRGMVNPFMISYKEENINNGIDVNLIDGISFYNNYQELKGLLSKSVFNKKDLYYLSYRSLFSPKLKGNKLSQALNLNGREIQNIGPDGFNIFGINDKFVWTNNGVINTNVFSITGAFNLHQRLSAEVSGYDLYNRKEAIVVEPKSENKFRIVNIDDTRFTNYKIISGKRPSLDSEIAISRQYAVLNNKKIGDSIRIADSVFLITAFAVDTYSFYTAADPDVPLPKSKTDAIIYMSSGSLDKLISRTGSPNENLISWNFNYFLIEKDNMKSNFNDFIYWNNSSNMFLNKNIGIKNELKDSTMEMSSIIKFKNFSDSFYSFNWVLFKYIFNSYSMITIFTSILIFLISLLALFITIVKTIKSNSFQIGILKANGVYSSVISWSYVSFPIFICFISIPLGWFLGTLLQSPFIAIINPYFSYEVGTIFIDFYAPLISLLIFGLFMTIISFVTTFIMCNKPYLEVISHSIKWSKSTILEYAKDNIFKNSKFGIRLTLQLTSSGKQPISFLILFIFIGSSLLMGGLSVPMIAINAKKEYFSKLEYKNSFSMNKNISNSPFSKDAINIWSGHQKSDENSYTTFSGLDGESYKYYKDPTLYSKSVTNASIIPNYIYSQKGQNISSIYERLIEKYKTATSLSDKVALISFMTSILPQHIALPSFKSLSLGLAEEINAHILNGKLFKTDADKRAAIQLFSKQLNEMAPQLFSSFIPSILEKATDAAGSQSENQNNNPQWKKNVLKSILSMAPSYTKSFLTTENRQNLFSFGFQQQNIVKDKEFLGTIINSKDDKENKYNITGLDKNQKAYRISEKDKNNTFLSIDKKNQIEDVFKGINTTQDIKLENGFLLYDSKNNTVNIPTLSNKQLKISNNVQDIASNIKTKSKLYRYVDKNGINTTLPDFAWVYDDTNYVNSEYFSEEKSQRSSEESYNGYFTKNGRKYLDNYKLDGNKFVVGNNYSKNEDPNNKKTSLKENTSMFGDFDINKTDGKVQKSFIRPYYQYKDVKLFLPESTTPQNFIDQATNGTRKVWSEVGLESVPDHIIEGYKKIGINDQKFYEIRPCDISLSDENIDYNEVDAKNAFNTLVVSGDTKTWINSVSEETGILAVEELDYEYLNKTLKINLKIVGEVESYGSQLAIVDSNLANLMTGFSTAKLPIYDYNRFDKTKVDRGKEFETYDYREIKKSNSIDAYKDSFIKKEQLLAESPHMYFNTIFSNVEEPLNMTSIASLQQSDKFGSLVLRTAKLEELKVSINDVSLLSEIQGLINQLVSTSIFIGIIIILAITISSILLIMLVGDIYISKYKKFIIMLRSLGYQNYEIMLYTLGSTSFFAIIAWSVSVLLLYVSLAIGTQVIVGVLGFYIPITISILVPIISLIIMSVSYLTSLMVASYRARNESPAIMMKEES